MWNNEANEQDGRVWQSKCRTEPGTIMQIDASHRALFERVETSISCGFAAAQRALVDLQLQLQIKLRQLREQQEIVLQTQSPSSDAMTEFEDNMRKIDRSLESFTAHADNLSHIKLTLARAAAFVSPEGNLAQLVTAAQPKPHRDLLWQQEPMHANALVAQTIRSTSVAPPYPSLHVGRTPPSGFGSSLLNSGVSNLNRLGRSLERNLEHDPLERNLERGLECSVDYAQGDGLHSIHSSQSSNRIPNSTCFVFYLPASATNDTLRQLFMRYGTVLNAYVAMDKITNRTRGFGFIDFSTPSEAQSAVAGLDKYPWDGKFLSVSIKV